MACTKQENKCITLQGSAGMVRQYLEYAASNILYQRGVCPPDDFKQSKYYGLNLFKMNKQEHVEYLARTLGDIKKFLMKKQVNSVLLDLIKKDTREYLETWEFQIVYENKKFNNSQKKPISGNKNPQDISDEISAVIRQILGVTTVLPLLEKNKVTYAIRAKPKPGAPVWNGWHTITENTTIANQQQMEFRSFSTSIHGVKSKVQYKGV